MCAPGTNTSCQSGLPTSFIRQNARMEPAGAMIMFTRRHLFGLSAIQAFAQNLFIREGRTQTAAVGYPTKPVRIIVPVAAGGPTDIVARMLAEKLSAMWSQQVFIENRPGAGNNIGSEYVARSDPDGYTVLFDPGAIAANSSLYNKLSYDGFRILRRARLSPGWTISCSCRTPHSVEEFIDYVRSRPGQLTMASPGTGSA